MGSGGGLLRHHVDLSVLWFGSVAASVALRVHVQLLDLLQRLLQEILDGVEVRVEHVFEGAHLRHERDDVADDLEVLADLFLIAVAPVYCTAGICVCVLGLGLFLGFGV